MKKVIVALDVDTIEEVEKFVGLLTGIEIFKIGPRLFLKYGKNILDILHKNRKKVFLDLKFHDIPNTVYHSVKEVVKLNVYMLTIHTLGGREMIKSASQAAEEESLKLGIEKPKIMGVTVLTSMDKENVKEVGFGYGIEEMVKRLSILSFENGADGVIASPREIKIIRETTGENFLIATPGIRFEQSKDDQKRTLSPSEAFALGANYIIIGRPLLSESEKVMEELLKIKSC
ncbi:MAG: orotidine-5'-phosphate decarboxylase [Candidatus Aminicenantia bacterium]